MLDAESRRDTAIEVSSRRDTAIEVTSMRGRKMGEVN
jgi:hypothetical protein